MTAGQIVSATESIDIVEQEVAADSIPAGLTDGVTTKSPPASLQAGLEASFSFTSKGKQKPALQLGLTTATAIPSPPDADSRQVDINGSVGWISKPDLEGQVWIKWSPGPGVRASMSVKGSQAQAVRLARSMRKADTNDSRLER